MLQNLWPEFNPLAIENAVRSGVSRHNFHTDSICPIWPQAALPMLPSATNQGWIESDKKYVLELFYGPTGSFKDIYSLLFPYLISTRKLAVMASGGSGAIAAFNGFAIRGRAKLIIFYPKNGISERHYLELTTEESENVIVACVDAELTEIQTMLDSIAFRNDRLTLLHSIHFGKTAPLAAIILSSYCELLARHKIALGETINVIAPTKHSTLQQAIDLSVEIGIPIDVSSEKTLLLQAEDYNDKKAILERPIVQDAIVTLAGMEDFIRMAEGL